MNWVAPLTDYLGIDPLDPDQLGPDLIVLARLDLEMRRIVPDHFGPAVHYQLAPPDSLDHRPIRRPIRRLDLECHSARYWPPPSFLAKPPLPAWQHIHHFWLFQMAHKRRQSVHRAELRQGLLRVVYSDGDGTLDQDGQWPSPHGPILSRCQNPAC